MATQKGKVKSVLSGDTILVASTLNPSLEQQISLAFVTSPRLRKEGDEPWAFESRDYLRKLLVGKVIDFQVVYEIPKTKRKYCIVALGDIRLPEAAVQAGWLKLREDAGRKDDLEPAANQLSELKLFEAQAKAEDKGIWATTGGRIEVQHDMGDPQEFLKEWKGKSADGLVERILSGDRMLLRLIVTPKKHIQVMTLVAGIRAPTTERVNPSTGTTQAAEEYGNESRSFVEDRLLQRNVKVEILGLSPQNQLVASVIHPNGSIAKFLLEAGLARCTDYHSALLGAGMAQLRQAEKAAQAAKRGVFKGHASKADAAGGNSDVTVSRVFSADVVYVRNKAGVEKRVNISSIRGPRQNEAAEAPFRDEAKEFLRKKIIGKHVRMSIDGSRPAVGEYEAKEVASISLGEKNIGLLLVQEGWASVVRHRKDDTDRAPNWDELSAAEATAKEDKKGMWSGKAATAKSYSDASETVQKAKMQLATLQRQKKIPAIVDFVKGASRFVILIPREGVKLTFVLGGIQAPKSARSATEKSEPFGQEAHDLATKRCSQRDVEIDVHSIDRNGGFIGELYLNRESFAKTLIEEGLATVHEYSAEQSGNATELLGAQSRAKEARKNLWKDWDPSQDEVEEEAVSHGNGTNGDAAPVERKADYKDVVVTNIDATGKLKIQLIGSGTSALETLMSAFKSFHINPSNSASLPGPPKNGDFVAAKFSEDGQWYRGRIRSNDRTAKKAEVVYIDYGNSEQIAWSNLRPLSQPQFNIQKLKGQAVDAVFSLIQLPTNPEYLKDSISYMTELTAGRELVANVDFTGPDGTLFITLFDQTSTKPSDSINADIIREGLAMVPRKLKPWERNFSDILNVLKEKEIVAKEERRGMWEYGDLTED